MQALVSRRVLKTMPIGIRLVSAPLLRSSASFWFRQASYKTPSSFSIRTSSTSSGLPEDAKTHVFVIWAPDYTDKDTLARRLAVREKHLHGTKPGQEAGYYCERFSAIRCLKLIPLQCSAVPSLPLSRLPQQTLQRKWRDRYYSSEQSLSKKCEQM